MDELEISGTPRSLIVQSVPQEILNLPQRGRKSGPATWNAIIQRVMQMTATEAVEYFGEAIQNLSKYGDKTLKELMVIRAVQEFMENPSANIWNTLMEREEGRVADTVNVNQISAIEVHIRKVEQE